jgi:hypothetical protein
MATDPKSRKKSSEAPSMRIGPGTGKTRGPLLPEKMIKINEAAASRATASPAFVELAVKSLTELLGHNRTAALLGVDKSRLTRCVTGKENYGADLVRRIYNLHYILVRALEVMQPDEVGPWLMESDPLLGGSVPMNVLQLSGPARVIQALEARAAGAFA